MGIHNFTKCRLSRGGGFVPVGAKSHVMGRIYALSRRCASAPHVALTHLCTKSRDREEDEERTAV